MTLKKNFGCLVSALLICAAGCGSVHTKGPGASEPAPTMAVGADECRQIVDEVDKKVTELFYNKQIVDTVWRQYMTQHKSEMLAANNLKELSERINAAIKVLHSSHCEFITTNDETYYFLNSLWSVFNTKKYQVPMMDFTGAITGGVSCRPNQIRFVLDGSPAAQAGLKIGDEVLSVDGKPFAGQSSFWGTAGREVPIVVRRGGSNLPVKLKPELKDDYKEYVNAIWKSVRTFKVEGGTAGYIHLWAGGPLSHDAFEAAISDKLSSTDGIILDLRSGYGGNWISDLDTFYRTAQAFPDFERIERSGKKHLKRDYYDKPVVALIDGGSRSGKEMVALSLKKTGRATLVGERTAGAVVLGQLFPINKRCALYLAILDAHVGGARMEGVGVEPDVVVPAGCSQEGYDRQLAEATKLLSERLASGHKPAR